MEKRFDEAQELINVIPIWGYILDLTTFNDLVRALCIIGKITLALEFLENMVTGIHPQPDIVIYITILDIYCT